MAQKLIVYKPPEWSRVLKDIPKAFIQVAYLAAQFNTFVLIVIDL